MNTSCPTCKPVLSQLIRAGRVQELRRGFTLVELLVVISIIALLISLLLPALASAREASIGVRCLSNLKQQGLAFMTYNEDNSEVFPPCYDGTYMFNPNFDGRFYWAGKLHPYAGGVDFGQPVPWGYARGEILPVFNCDGNPFVKNLGGRTQLYLVNYYLNPYWSPPYPAPASWRRSRLPKPSGLLLTADANGNPGDPNSRPAYHSADFTPSYAAYHLGNVNTLHCDGHATAYRPQVFFYEPTVWGWQPPLFR